MCLSFCFSTSRSAAVLELWTFDDTMKRRLIPILTPEILASMPTKLLLGRLRSLHQCEASAALSDRKPEEIAASVGVVFKDTAEWQTAYTDLKAVLATREHVASAAERALARNQRTMRKSNKRGGGDCGAAPLSCAGRRRPAAPHHDR